MRRILPIALALALFVISPLCASIRWTRDFETAKATSQATGKPILLFFTGSDWCGWCNRLQQEVFNSEEFDTALENKFVFVYLDYPMRAPIPEEERMQNRDLQQRFQVRSFPNLIILDQHENLIGQMGYGSGRAKDYSDQLLKMIGDYENYRQKMADLDPVKLSGKELKRMYQKAKELGNEEDIKRLLRIGVLSDQKQYFYMERYRQWVQDGKMSHPEAQSLKKSLLEADPENNQLTHYQIAVIEFEKHCEEMESGVCPLEVAIEPLTKYLGEFGKQDRENKWRLELVISQVYLDENRLSKALQYAEASYHAAPSSIQPEIENAITNIRSLMPEGNYSAPLRK